MNKFEMYNNCFYIKTSTVIHKSILLFLTEEKNKCYEEGLQKVQTGLREICGAIGASYTNLTNPVLAIISSFKAEFELRPDLENETKQAISVREMKGRLTGIRHDLNWLGEVMGGTYLTLQNQPIPKKASDVKAIKR